MLCQSIPMSKTNPKAVLHTYILDDYPQFCAGERRPAVVVLPGGAYMLLSEREAELVALQFCAAGYHAFVLSYSVGAAAKMPAPFLDGFTAIATIRDRAEEWRVDAEKLVVCGFSAGGHVAGGLMTMWKDSEIQAATGRTAEALRPNVGILCYPPLKFPFNHEPKDTGLPISERRVLLKMLEGELQEPQHPDWRAAIFERDETLWMDTERITCLNCFGSLKPSAEQISRYDVVGRVDVDTPPAFLWATTTDEVVPAGNTVAFSTAMLNKGRPVELHLFGSGEHALSLSKRVTGSADDHHPSAHWFELALNWLGNVLKAPEKATGSPFAGMEYTRGYELPYEEKPQQYYANIYRDREGMFRHSPFSLEQHLLNFVMEGDEKAAIDALGSISRQGAKAVLAKDPLRSVRNSIICSCTILTRAAIQAGVPDEEAFALSDAEIMHIENLTSEAEVLKYEAAMVMQFIKLVKKHRGRSYSAPVRRALHYIDAHLEQPILLGEVADYAGVHPNYLSKRFRQETGTALSGYANARKIREAAYFVQHTDYPMAEIAALYGFSSQSYFISSFKKVMGAPPGEFRSR